MSTANRSSRSADLKNSQDPFVLTALMRFVSVCPDSFVVRPNESGHYEQVPRISIVNLLFLALLIFAGSSSASQAQSLRQAIQSAWPRVVKIFGAGGFGDLESYSTGFLVSPDGYVATIWNHVLDADEVTVVLNDGRRFPGRVVGAEPPLGLAILKLQAEDLDLPYFDLSESATASPGTRVLAFSNMFGIANGDEPVSVVQGVLSARTVLSARKGTYEIPYRGPIYVVDAITNNSGAGGGVLTTWSGKLLGMIGQELRNTQSNTWVNYAIPVAELEQVVHQIITGQFGTEPTDAPEQDPAKQYKPLDFGLVLVPDVVYRTPAYIDSIVPKSAAEQAGLQPDDLILFANGELVPSCRSFRESVGRLELGDRLELVVRRGSELVEVEMSTHRK